MLITRPILAAASNAILRAADALKRDRTNAQGIYFGADDCFLLSMWFDETAQQFRANLEHCDAASNVVSLACGSDPRPYRAAVCVLATLAERQAREDNKPSRAPNPFARPIVTPRNNH